MSGVGKGLIAALALSYLALGAFSQLLYGGDVMTGAGVVVGGLLLLGLAAASAWASAQRRGS